MTFKQKLDMITLCNLVKESADTVKAYAARGDEASAKREMQYLERTVDNVRKCLYNEYGLYEASADFIQTKV